MKTNQILFLLICFFLLENCAITKWQDTLISKGNINDAVNNAIIDFVHTSKISKKDSVFNVTVTDINEEKITITIGVADDVIYPNMKNIIGAYDNVFPTRYIVINDKLFYWNDTTQVITQEVFFILEKYNHIDYRWKEYPVIVGGVHNDRFKGVVYYFCKNDLTNYKKTGVSNFRKHNKVPTLNCKQSKARKQ